MTHRGRPALPDDEIRQRVAFRMYPVERALLCEVHALAKERACEGIKVSQSDVIVMALRALRKELQDGARG